MEKSTPDFFLGRDTPLFQPEKGYRFSLDPFLVSAHIQVTGVEKIIDIGCGCGIIPLILASRYPGVNITGIEIQVDLFEFAQKNILAHGLSNTIHILHDDIKNIYPSQTKGKADIIVSNPPYIKKNSGRLNPDVQKAIARHELCLDIDTLFKCASRLLLPQGRLYLIFPAQRVSELMATMEKHEFAPDFIRFVHTKKNTAAHRVILCAAKNMAGPCAIYPPLYLYTSENKFSDVYIALFKP